MFRNAPVVIEEVVTSRTGDDVIKLKIDVAQGGLTLAREVINSVCADLLSRGYMGYHVDSLCNVDGRTLTIEEVLNAATEPSSDITGGT